MAKQSSRENLIEVGLGLIREAGYTATGIHQVLEVAGMPKGLFYHHFATKDEFVMWKTFFQELCIVEQTGLILCSVTA